MQDPLSRLFVSIFFTYPKITGLFGLVISILSLIIAINSWRQWQSIPTEPEQMTLEEAAAAAKDGEIWATIQDGEWDCDNLFRDDSTTALLVNESRTVAAAVIFSDPLSCNQIQSMQPSGSIRPLSDYRYNYLSGQMDLAQYEDAVMIDVCTYCNREGSLLSLVMASVFFLLGLTLYPLARMGHKALKTQSTQADSTAA